MPSILTTSEWHQSIASLVDHIGTDDFSRYLVNSLQLSSPYDSTLITAFYRDQRPKNIYHNLPKELAEKSTAPYYEGAYLLDPFYALYLNKAPSGVYRLKDVAPDKFYGGEYFRTYYMDTGLQDEAGLLIEVNSDLHILISLGGRDSEHVASKGQFSKLTTILPLLISICQQHWKNHDPRREMLDTSTLGAPLDVAFNNFGKEFLTDRECEVVQLILKGHSSKSIARLLEISEDTVKVHRKRFHSKLDISSQAELFSLFLESIALVPMGSDEDPLSLYFNGERTTPAPP